MSSRASAATGRYAMVNGLRMYYEVHGAMRGTGRPLVLLHGHTADRERPLSFAHDADDVAVLLRELAVPEVDLLGFSNGANAALKLAR